jgi:hypothetical protein
VRGGDGNAMNAEENRGGSGAHCGTKPLADKGGMDLRSRPSYRHAAWVAQGVHGRLDW